MKGLHRWWQPWWTLGFFAFLVHFPWEILQAPLYAGLAEARHWQATVLCTTATMGDVLITWTAYGVVATWTRSKEWIRDPSVARVTGFLVVGLGITVLLEVLNVYHLDRWSYGEAMPVGLGIGISPVLQWILLPGLILWLVRRHHE